MNDNFGLKKAYHAKQAAYDEMSNAREKLAELNQSLISAYSEVEKLQADYDVSREQQNEAWQEYNARQLEMKELIADKITAEKESNVLEENFRLMSENAEEEPGKAEIYAEASKCFSGVAKQKVVERDNLITTKRNMPRPSNYASEQILEKLKLARIEHNEILENYHNAKNEFTLKKQNFDRLSEKYNNILNGESANACTCTNRPEKLEIDESLLVKANVPEKYWGNCSMMKRANGIIDIYYGADEKTSHGHIVMLGDEIKYARLPQPNDLVMV